MTLIRNALFYRKTSDFDSPSLHCLILEVLSLPLVKDPVISGSSAFLNRVVLTTGICNRRAFSLWHST